MLNPTSLSSSINSHGANTAHYQEEEEGERQGEIIHLCIFASVYKFRKAAACCLL